MTSIKKYKPRQDIVAEFPQASGNEVNGLGEEEIRPPSPFFWHPPDRHSLGGLQKKVLECFSSAKEIAQEYSLVIERGSGRRPEKVICSDGQLTYSAKEWSEKIQQFSLENEADVVGCTTLKSDYLFESYNDNHSFIIVVGVAHDYDAMKTAPSGPNNMSSAVEVARQYNRGARAVNKLRNYILEQGYSAKAYPGPMADAINLIPAAIDCGLGELGKHGSLINRKLGSSFRLAAVTTDMPLLISDPDTFGVDDVCHRCKACERACPPGAIFSEKQIVRGTEKWYVDFDKCIPFFAETYGCGACIVVCPWSVPGVADNLLVKMARQKNRTRSD